MKRNTAIKTLCAFLSALILASSALTGAAYCVDLSQDHKEQIDPGSLHPLKKEELLSNVPSADELFKSELHVFSDEAKTNEIADLGTLRAGEEYYYTLESKPGEVVTGIEMIARDASEDHFVAPRDGGAALDGFKATTVRPGDVTARVEDFFTFADIDAEPGLYDDGPYYLAKEYEPKLNARDVITMMKFILGKSDFEDTVFFLDNADFNLDGKYNSRDVVALMKHILGAPSGMEEKLAGGAQTDFDIRLVAGRGGKVIPSASAVKEATEYGALTVDGFAQRCDAELTSFEALDEGYTASRLRDFLSLPAKGGVFTDLDVDLSDERLLLIDGFDISDRWIRDLTIPVCATNDPAKRVTTVYLLRVRLEDYPGYGSSGELVYDPAIFENAASVIPAAHVYANCFYDDVSVEFVGDISIYDYLDCEPEYPGSRTFEEKESNFAFALLRDTLAAKGVDNAMISPLSFQLCLALAANGAKGETLAGIEKLAGLSLDEMNDSLAPFAASLKKTSAGEYDPDKFNVANSAWFKSGYNVVPEYTDRIAQYFAAQSRSVPFDSGTLDEVNGWVSEETYGMIDSILDEFPEGIVSLLINAVAFEGEWSEPFVKEFTRKETFHGFDGNNIDADMMVQTDTMPYLENESFIGFVKYYQSHYAFVALLPKWDGAAVEGGSPSREALASAIGSLDGESWKALFDNKLTADVTVKMPKFKNEYELSTVKELLRDKPLPALFDPLRADLSGMMTSPFGNNVYASDMIQKTFVEVDERGTRAAAVTYMIMKETAVLPQNPKRTVILDRPFVYAIIDTNTNVPIFIGTVTEP